MVKGMVEYFAEKTGAKLNQLNVIPGYVEPSDMREIKRIAEIMGVKIVMFPDTSNVVDTPQTGKFNFFPKGGTKISELKSTADSFATIALGQLASAPAAKLLDVKFKVPCEILGLPIGILGTDRFVDSLRKLGGASVPESLNDERGRLIDVIADMHQYLYGKKVALVGDPDQLVSLTEFLVSMDMKPVHIVTGTPGQKFESRIKEITADKVPNVNVKAGGDMFLLHQWIKNEKVDLIMGNTYCKYIARDEDIPYIRYGFPIVDRIGHSYFPSVGYMGGLRLVEKILDAIMDRQDRDAKEESFELVM